LQPGGGTTHLAVGMTKMVWACVMASALLGSAGSASAPLPVSVVSASSTLGRGAAQTRYDAPASQASNAVDGDTSTAWVSELVVQATDWPQWVLFDLGEVTTSLRTVRSVRLHVSGADDTPLQCSLQRAGALQPAAAGTSADVLASGPARTALAGLPSAATPAVGSANASHSAGAPFGAAAAFDGNPSTQWISCLRDCFRGADNVNADFPESYGYGAAFPVELSYAFAPRPGGEAPPVITQYALTGYVRNPTASAAAAAARAKMNPRDWTFEGSHSGEAGDWAVLDTRQQEVFGESQARSFGPFANVQAFGHYRFVFTAAAADGASAGMGTKASVLVSDVELRAAGEDLSGEVGGFVEAGDFSVAAQPGGGWQTFGGFDASARFVRLTVKNNHAVGTGSEHVATASNVRISEVQFIGD